ncbi:MAG: BMC domain-containing protein [Clostridia bacterium]|jgi:microcompartment protein CcmL/EutN|nr:BMC domain-containing protein [Clostridia bacterium]MBQ5801956.1 BMC domain-containing protein [Clostridia bacterium]
MAQAVGIVEVYGLTAAFVAGDAGCKAADVTLEIFDKNKPANADSLPVPLIVVIKFRGSVAAVEEAVQAACEAAKTVSGVVTYHVIPQPLEGTDKMFKISGLDKS